MTWLPGTQRNCRELAAAEEDPTRAQELEQMAANLDRVPWEPARTFWEAVQALWLNHMLIMSDENYPGPGISFGRIDQYLLPYWERSLEEGMDREFGKEILKCFWIHANTAYDAMIRVGGNQGITAGFGQLLTLSGMGPGGKDMTNDLTVAILEVIDEMSPILEPKPNVRLHKNSSEELLDKVVDMLASSQGAPFLLNFDERSMAGMMLQAKKAGCTHLIHEKNVHEYAPVGCLENTMVGNDRSGTVDNNLNLLKAVELALTGGKDLLAFEDPITGRKESDRPGRAGHGGCFEVYVLGGVLEGLHDPDRVHREEVRRSVRALGIAPGPFRPHALPVLPGQGMCRKGAGHHPRWGGTLLHHAGSGYVRHDR